MVLAEISLFLLVRRHGRGGYREHTTIWNLQVRGTDFKRSQSQARATELEAGSNIGKQCNTLAPSLQKSYLDLRDLLRLFSGTLLLALMAAEQGLVYS